MLLWQECVKVGHGSCSTLLSLRAPWLGNLSAFICCTISLRPFIESTCWTSHDLKRRQNPIGRRKQRWCLWCSRVLLFGQEAWILCSGGCFLVKQRGHTVKQKLCVHRMGRHFWSVFYVKERNLRRYSWKSLRDKWISLVVNSLARWLMAVDIPHQRWTSWVWWHSVSFLAQHLTVLQH